MFGGYDPYGGYGYRPARSPQRKAQKFESSKWRVVAERPLAVSAEQDGRDVVADLEPRATCDVVRAQQLSGSLARNGEVRR